jgi:hypothetical protein
MRATKYFKTKAEMTLFAEQFKAKQKNNWYLRTTLRCDHVLNENRNAIVLINNETIQQRLIECKICNTHGNAINVEPKKEQL